MSTVTDMNSMFCIAVSFNGDISNWDASSFIIMCLVFLGAASFNQTLCGDAWIHSKATKRFMSMGSSESISQTVCTHSIFFTTI